MALLESAVVKIVGKFFEGRLDQAIVDRRLRLAKERLLNLLLDNLEALAGHELSEDQHRVLVAEFTALGEAVDFGPRLYAEHGYDADGITTALLTQHPPDREVAQLGVLPRYQDMVRQLVLRLSELAPEMRDWELANWSMSFQRLTRIEAGIGATQALVQELRDAPERRQETYEQRYRQHVLAAEGTIRLQGIQGVAQVLDLPMAEAYVSLHLADCAPEALPDDTGPAELARLRTELSERRTRLAEADGRGIEELLHDERRLVIVGAPGAGKTTLMKWLACRAAQGELAAAAWVPFLFRVRALPGAVLPSPAEFLAHLAPALQLAGSADFVGQVLQAGRALLIVDGLDECQVPDLAAGATRRESSQTEWDRLMASLHGFLSAWGDNRVVITSRPSGYRVGLLRDHGFAEVALQPLGGQERQAFVSHWYRAVELNRPGAAPAAAVQAAEAKAADLVERLEGRSPSLQLLATNPLMLSAICVVHHTRGARLPEKRAELLRACVDTLLYEWRATANLGRLLNDLDTYQQRALLEPLAWAMIEQGQAEWSRAQVERLFAERLPELGWQSGDAAGVVNTIRDQTGVLVESRPGVFAFAHLILQEYLAAEHAPHRGLDAVLSHAGEPAWREVIPLAAATLKGHCEGLVRSLLQKGEVVLAGRAAACAPSLSPALRRQVIQRLVKRLGDYKTDTEQALVEIGGEAVVRGCLARLLAVRGVPYREGLADLAADLAALFAANLAALFAADLAADLAANLAALFAADRAADLAADLAADVADVAAAHAVARAADRAAAVLERLSEAARGPVQEALADAERTTWQRLWLLSIRLEGLRRDELDGFYDQLAALPPEEYPLTQLALAARCHHRFAGVLDAAQRQRLAGLFARNYDQLGRHYVRWAKALDAALREQNKPGITADWPAYEAEFMATYTARLNELKPPGWVVGEVAEAPPG